MNDATDDDRVAVTEALTALQNPRRTDHAERCAAAEAESVRLIATRIERAAAELASARRALQAREWLAPGSVPAEFSGGLTKSNLTRAAQDVDMLWDMMEDEE